MIQKRYKYKFDKRSKYISWSIIAAVLVGGGVLFGLTIGSFISAWYVSVIVAAVALCCLSIPRYVEIKDGALYIQCTVEIRQILLKEIHTVRDAGAYSVKKYFPVLADHGFWGYVGYYFDTQTWDIVRVYATDLSHLVEIEDIYEQRYLISVENPAQFAADVMEARDEALKTDDEE